MENTECKIAKKLSVLIKQIEVLSVKCVEAENPKCAPVITNIAFDSRLAKGGSLFFALPGVHVNGNVFIKNAVENGCAAVVYQGELPCDAENLMCKNCVPAIEVKSSRFAMSPIAASFYDYPSTKLAVIGITGTEGKSSTVSFTWQLLRAAGKKAGFISTVEYSLGNEAIANPEHQTTPESPIIQEKLYQMLLNGCEYAVIECSSHALSEKNNRVGDVLFDVAAMMNVTHEHLEFHGTWEQYRNDKANLFRMLEKHDHVKYISGIKTSVPSFAIVNLDDKAAEYFVGCTTKHVFGFTAKNNSTCLAGVTQININSITASSASLDFDLDGLSHVSTSVSGAFNAFNITASLLAVSGIIGKNVSDIAPFAKNLKGVKGRMTQINEGQNFEVIVDYAHTPSSFETIMPTVKQRCKGRLFCVFGSAGERDKQKRPLQGAVAAKYCDVIFLADEDPRGEIPETILEEIAQGCIGKDGKPLARGKNLFLIPDRKTAIKKAFSMAQKNDIVLLLGKSHENSIIYKDFVMNYDEIETAKSALKELQK